MAAAPPPSSDLLVAVFIVVTALLPTSYVDLFRHDAVFILFFWLWICVPRGTAGFTVQGTAPYTLAQQEGRLHGLAVASLRPAWIV